MSTLKYARNVCQGEGQERNKKSVRELLLTWISENITRTWKWNVLQREDLPFLSNKKKKILETWKYATIILMSNSVKLGTSRDVKFLFFVLPSFCCRCCMFVIAETKKCIKANMTFTVLTSATLINFHAQRTVLQRPKTLKLYFLISWAVRSSLS